MIRTTDFVVIGSGIAGLSAAIYLQNHGTVYIITKSGIRESNSQYAQGGIATAIHSSDSPSTHATDTIQVGSGLCNPEAVQILTEEGVDRVQELIAWGTPFDKIGDVLDLTLEGAHSNRRILHVGDSTGLAITTVLTNQLTNATTIITGQVVDLIQTDGRVTGVTVDDGKTQFHIGCRAVIIATGGYAQCYAPSTNPLGATGNGIALGFRHGASVHDMEFIQFHPTAFWPPQNGTAFLISESLRGEGAILRNNAGDRFMTEYHPDGDLAPRDITSRAITDQLRQTQSTHVYLDATRLKISIPDRFPTIFTFCKSNALDITKNWIPVAPAAHYCMGGLITDTWGKTTVTGLYAAGEVASSGVHGANRLPSNSLLEGLVFGRRAAIAAASEPKTDKKNIQPLPQIRSSSNTPLRESIQKLMQENVGILRDQNGIETAIAYLKSIFHATEAASCDIRSLWTCATLTAAGALARTESRGAHFRTDFSERVTSLGTHLPIGQKSAANSIWHQHFSEYWR